MVRLAAPTFSLLVCQQLFLALCASAPSPDSDHRHEVDDVAAFVQVHDHGARRGPRVSNGVIVGPSGPMAFTADGAILGAQESGYIVFRSVPYAEKPERFEKAALKAPWEPRVLNATDFGPGCISSYTSGVYGESEDCLTLNIWMPKGLHRKMPVIVYLHGGLNQHGSGHEEIRQGDLIVQSPRYPTIFINFDFRLAIFGWIYGERGSGITNNLGLMDQQLLLRWVQRHIGAFGGDPDSVTLMGQSEGAAGIIAHLTSPASKGLFHRCVLHSPPADVWSRTANADRTKFVSDGAGCRRKGKRLLQCLRKVPAQKLLSYDFNAEALSRPGQKKEFMKTIMSLMKFTAEKKDFRFDEAMADLGWHPVVDDDVMPGEPRRLIAEGKWNRVPVLITTVKNESYGVLPDVADAEPMMSFLLKKGELEAVAQRYTQTLQRSHIQAPPRRELLHQMLTDKVWTCEIRALAKDMLAGGGKPHIGMFWHSIRYDPVGAGTSKACVEGAACHAADMFYLLPQGRGKGIDPRLAQEVAFSRQYSNDILSFIYGQGGTWAPFDASEAMTFYDARGPRVEHGYRREQCEVLDASMGALLPEIMRERR